MTEPEPAAAVVLAGGSGSRVGAERNKVLLDLAGTPVLAHSLRTVASLPSVVRVVVVAREADVAEVRELADAYAPGATVVVGGADRPSSERAAFAVLAEDVEAGRVRLVAVHDGARPLASTALWTAVLDAAAAHGGALPARSLGATLADAPGSDGSADSDGPVLHEDLVGVSTPQAFRADALLEAYASAATAGFAGTDTASYLERHPGGCRVATVPDEATNLKITWPGDIERAVRLSGSATPDEGSG
ncbi:2-C-methyl-D-erythritol 4-phosphate cytidylyltransferase [Nocardioidaceae bacterium]|nr:2-C-methyl-D-erythritol 4-phosphate cytidylyltransferase [Nocardioidaceae bacterium]